MAQSTQFRLGAITASFGSESGKINDSLANRAALANINTIDLSGSLSYLASSIRRIHGGADFSNQQTGSFALDVLPDTTNFYALGNDEKKWKNLVLQSGSIQSITAPGTNNEESLAIIANPGTSLVFSSSLNGDTFSHNFQGVPLELDSLASTKSDYDSANGMTTQGGIPVALYNINGVLYWGDNIINGDYNQFKEVTKITSQVSAGTLLSTSNFSTFSVADIPVANRYRAIEVYLNGVLQESGSNAQVTADPPTCDYFLDDSTASAADLKFGGDIEVDDNIVVMARYAENVTQTPQDLTQIIDADGDTKIQVEESADEDLIRFDTNGSERMIIRNDGRVGIGVSSGLPNVALTLDGSGIAGSVGDLSLVSKMTHKGDSNTFLEFPAADQINIEAGGQNMIRMVEDSPNNRVLILSGGASSDNNEDNYTDLNFFVSGSIGSIGSTTRGAAVFGGDVVVSGSLSVLTDTSIEDHIVAELSIPGTAIQTTTDAFTFNCPYNLTVERLDIYLSTDCGAAGSVRVAVTGSTAAGASAQGIVGATITGNNVFNADSTTITNGDRDANTRLTFAIETTDTDARNLRANLQFRRRL